MQSVFRGHFGSENRELRRLLMVRSLGAWHANWGLRPQFENWKNMQVCDLLVA